MRTRMLAIIVLFAVAIAALLGLVRLIEPRVAFFPSPGEDVTPAHYGIQFVTLSIDTADGERLRGWHLPRADARAQVLYFHGNGGNLSFWSDVFAGLWQAGLEVIAIDYRGYGVSTGSPTERGLYRDVEATLTVFNTRVRRDDVPVLFWGRSLGAAMAAYAAQQSVPQGAPASPPDGVVLEAGFPSVRALFARHPVMLPLSLLSRYRFAAADWMREVHVPTLVVHGDSDSVIPYRLGQQLYESLPGPKRFVTMPGGDHNDPAPADAALYWREVSDFIATLR